MEATPIFMLQAECKNYTETMYPEQGDERAEAIAKSICASCLVVEPCRDWAIKHRERQGIWGGMTEQERRQYANKLRRHGKL